MKIKPQSSKPLLYVALGDSLANGLGASRQGYVQRLHQKLVQKHPTELRLYAMSGQTSNQLLRKWPSYQKDVAQADIITWNIGGNDLNYVWRIFGLRPLRNSVLPRMVRQTISKLTNNWESLATDLRKTAPKNAAIVTFNFYNPYVGGPTMAQEVVSQTNLILADICRRHNIILIDAHHLLHKHCHSEHIVKYLAKDRFHLNAEGYELIAKAMYQHIYPGNIYQRLKRFFIGLAGK